jgi:hypothetical protein
MHPLLVWCGSFVMMLLFVVGGFRMAVAQALVLGDEPIPDAEVATELGFYSEESQLGTGKTLLKEGTITLGQTKLYRIKPETGSSTRRVQPPGTRPLESYLVVLPFTLHPAPGERKYRRVRFGVTLADKQIKAFSLMPKDIVTEEDVKNTYKLGGSVEYQGVGGTLELSKEITFTRLRPVTTAFGEGESDFYWIFESQSDQGVHPGSRRVATILEVPRGTRMLAAVITYKVDVLRRWLGDWQPFDAGTDPYPVQFHFSDR